jgi:hypothetical protein
LRFLQGRGFFLSFDLWPAVEQFEKKRKRKKRSRKQIPAFGKWHAYGGQASYRLARDADEFGMTGVGAGGEGYLDLAFIAFRLAFTSFFTSVVGTDFPFGKLTMAFVVA